MNGRCNSICSFVAGVRKVSPFFEFGTTVTRTVGLYLASVLDVHDYIITDGRCMLSAICVLTMYEV
jgi:hypothetical protein